MSDKPYELYRYFNSDGSSKDWAIRRNSDGSFTRRWGKTDTKLSEKTQKSKNPNEIHDLILSKTSKGYVFVGERYINDNGNITIDSPPAVSKPTGVDPNPTQEEPAIYWRIKISQMSVDDTKKFDAFKMHAISLSQFFGENSFVLNFIQKLENDGRGNLAGKLLEDHGVEALLFFMTLKKNAPTNITVSLSHEDGVEISDQLKMESNALLFFDTDMETVRPIAEEIGLLVKRIDLSEVVSVVEDFYF